MSIFKRDNTLKEHIEQLEKKNQELIAEQQSNIQKIKVLKEENTLLSKANAYLRQKYEETGLECPECYFVLQDTFKVCPNCGNKIIKRNNKNVNTNASIFKVENDKDGCIIVGYNGFKDKQIVIPSNINGRTVIGIWNRVFDKCGHIEEVIFEEGCQYIGAAAFAECRNLKKIKLPKSLLEIGGSAFSKCVSLREMIVPINVRKIGGGVFSGCANLSKIILPEGLEVIGTSTFSNTAICKIDIPTTVKVIKSFAFSNTNISEIELPEQLRVVDDNVFLSCPNLSKIVMHSNLEILGKEIFKGSHPVVYCAAGSKAQLYARKYRLECEEIQPVKHDSKIRLGVQWIDLCKVAKNQIRDGRLHIENINFEQWIEMIGGGKAKAYAYEVKNSYGVKKELVMHKYYTYDEAQDIKRELQAKEIDVTLFDYWGKSEV